MAVSCTHLTEVLLPAPRRKRKHRTNVNLGSIFMTDGLDRCSRSRQ